MNYADEGRPSTFRAAPKPDNFDAMAEAWNDPVQFRIEVARYHAQVRDHFGEGGFR